MARNARFLGAYAISALKIVSGAKIEPAKNQRVVVTSYSAVKAKIKGGGETIILTGSYPGPLVWEFGQGVTVEVEGAEAEGHLTYSLI